MVFQTATGVYSSYFQGPHPSHNGGGPIVQRFGDWDGGNEEINYFLIMDRAKPKKPPPDTFGCEHCGQVVLSKHIRHTPKMGFLCMKCIVSCSDRCYLRID